MQLSFVNLLNPTTDYNLAQQRQNLCMRAGLVMSFRMADSEKSRL